MVFYYIPTWDTFLYGLFIWFLQMATSKASPSCLFRSLEKYPHGTRQHISPLQWMILPSSQAASHLFLSPAHLSQIMHNMPSNVVSSSRFPWEVADLFWNLFLEPLVVGTDAFLAVYQLSTSFFWVHWLTCQHGGGWWVWRSSLCTMIKVVSLETTQFQHCSLLMVQCCPFMAADIMIRCLSVTEPV